MNYQGLKSITVLPSKKRSLAGIGVVFLLAFGLTGCLKTNNTPPPKMTYIYFMHLGVQLPPVDLYFGDTKVTNNYFSFGNVSGSYATIQPGAFDVKFRKGGSDSLVAGVPTALYDSLMPYTLILYNNEQGYGQAAKIDDDFTTTTTEKANYRFFHFSPDAGDVDFYIGDTKVEPYRSLADNVYGGLYNDFMPFNPGSYILTVKEAGTDVVLAKTSTQAELVKGYTYTFYLKGLKDGTGASALSIGVVQN